MNCYHHPDSQAVGVCVHCGSGLCAECAEKTPSQRLVCSPGCAQSLLENEAILASIRRKTLGGHRLTGYFCCGAAVVLLLFSAFAAGNKQWEMVMLEFPIALGLALSGFFYLRLANRIES